MPGLFFIGICCLFSAAGVLLAAALLLVLIAVPRAVRGRCRLLMHATAVFNHTMLSTSAKPGLRCGRGGAGGRRLSARSSTVGFGLELNVAKLVY